MSIVDFVLGRKLASREGAAQRIGWFEGVPAMGLDGLGSASYGPEAALTILMPLGASGLGLIAPIMGVIVALLLVLYLSYRQTIAAYPVNGGAYTVAKANLGEQAGLLAAAAIMIDYVLNVAVGISAGVGALTSAIPVLQPHTLLLCLAILALVTLVNLRGTAEAGLLFALPTYVFIASLLGLIAFGLWRVAASGGQLEPIVAPPPLAAGVDAVSLWLILRAFAAGCTAMTGVEAVSTGVSAFREPVVKLAHRTLTIICATLSVLLVGIALTAQAYHVGAMDQTQPDYQSVISQLAGAIAGRGIVYDITMASVLAVLCLSANTSFVGFPRLCRMVAADGYLPRPFALADRRLVFSIGIGFLTLTAGLFLVAFDGITDRLIPLFAIGAFLTFVMSQLGMVVHWRQLGGAVRGPLALNAIGAALTSVALVVIVVAKFTEGAWIVVLAIPATIACLMAIRRYYARLDARLAVDAPFAPGESEPPIVLVAIERRTKLTDHALRFAMTLSSDVIAVHLLRLEGPEGGDDGAAFRRTWDEEVAAPLAAQGFAPPRLVLLPAPYREIHGPLLAFMDKIDGATPGRSVAVLIPELVLAHWWERLLHTRRAEQLRQALLDNGGPRLNVIISPWRE